MIEYTKPITIKLLNNPCRYAKINNGTIVRDACPILIPDISRITASAKNKDISTISFTLKKLLFINKKPP